MESTAVALSHACCGGPLDNRFFYPHSQASRRFFRYTKLQCAIRDLGSLKNYQGRETKRANSEKGKLSQGFTSSTETSNSRFRERELEGGFGTRSISSNMWLGDLKAALGQRLNLQGLAYAISVLSKDKFLAIPHVRVPDIRYIDWAVLKSRGFQGVVFDKDNTITAAYSLSLWAPLEASMEKCKSVFGNNIAIFSNSAGLHEFDPEDVKARALEDAIGINVIRHRAKKPAGPADEIEKHFGCESSQLIMVGDRPLTDIVYGNRNGFFTILTDPLSLAEEPLIVRQVRILEMGILNKWSKQGLRPTNHKLISDPGECVRDHPL